MISSFASRQFILFLLSGSTAALANFSSRIVYNQWLDFSSSIFIAYLTGMVTAFVLMRLFVFTETTKNLHHSVLIFILLNLIAVAQTWLISMGLVLYILPAVDITQHTHEIAHATGIAFPVFTSYLGHKYWTFR